MELYLRPHMPLCFAQVFPALRTPSIAYVQMIGVPEDRDGALLLRTVGLNSKHTNCVSGLGFVAKKCRAQGNGTVEEAGNCLTS
jgi:hypothetical protein